MWADGATLAQPDAAEPRTVEPGTVTVTRQFNAGDVVELRLPLLPRVLRGDSRIDAVRGCVAVEQGPRVLCLESVDLDSAGLGTDDVADLRIDVGAGLQMVGGQVRATLVRATTTEAAWPYQDASLHETGAGGTELDQARTGQVALTPYHDWANRGPSTMRVWIPTA